MAIYEDANCTAEVQRVLFEGKAYFLRFPTRDADSIRAHLAISGLEEFVSWHPANQIARLKVINKIGLVRFFGREYDIRSDKFLEKESGLRQFQIILDDLTKLSRHILVSPNAAPGVNRIDSSSQPSLLERFNFYRQACLRSRPHGGLQDYVEQIVRNPHSRMISEHLKDHIWNSKRPSRQGLRSIFQNGQSFARLPGEHPLAVGRPGLNIPGSTEILFPLKTLRKRGIVSTDTPENRFIKHVLLDIERVCRTVAQSGVVTGTLSDQCQQLLNLSCTLLRHGFFNDIGLLQSIPYDSPTLGQRHGYRDLYRMFMRSRRGAQHIFQNLKDDAFIIELKDVSLLYEYWVFYKVVESLLEPDAVYLARSTVVKNGCIVNGAIVSDGRWSVHFNRTYVRKQGESYSLRLRPDVVIERVAPRGCPPLSIHVLDAKYKSLSQDVESDDEDAMLHSIRSVKPADIHKMHCYIDAIEGINSATAVYPGNKFIFYSTERTSPVVTAGSDLMSARGVGAIPLMPGLSNSDFEHFFAKLKIEESPSA